MSEQPQTVTPGVDFHASSPTPFGILGVLPVELRQHIFAYIFQDEEYFVCGSRLCRNRSTAFNAPLQLSRPLREEVIPLVVEHARLVFTAPRILCSFIDGHFDSDLTIDSPLPLSAYSPSNVAKSHADLDPDRDVDSESEGDTDTDSDATPPINASKLKRLPSIRLVLLSTAGPWLSTHSTSKSSWLLPSLIKAILHRWHRALSKPTFPTAAPRHAILDLRFEDYVMDRAHFAAGVGLLARLLGPGAELGYVHARDVEAVPTHSMDVEGGFAFYGLLHQELHEREFFERFFRLRRGAFVGEGAEEVDSLDKFLKG